MDDARRPAQRMPGASSATGPHVRRPITLARTAPPRDADADASWLRGGQFAIPFQGRTARLADGLWVALAIGAVLLNLIGIYGFRIANQPPSGLQRTLFQLSSDEQTALGTSSFLAAFYPYYVLIGELCFSVAFFWVAVRIFRRREHTWMTWFASLTLMSFGTSITNLVQPLKVSNSALLTSHDSLFYKANWISGIAFFYEAVATVCALLIFYLFPTWRFVPRWTGFCALVWIFANLIWLVGGPNIPWNFLYYDAFVAGSPYSLIAACLCFGTGIWAQIYRYLQTKDAAQRQQTWWLLPSLIAAVLAAIAFYAPPELPSIFAHISVAYKFIVVALDSFLLIFAAVMIDAHLLRNQPSRPLRIEQAFVHTFAASLFSLLYIGVLLLLISIPLFGAKPQDKVPWLFVVSFPFLLLIGIGYNIFWRRALGQLLRGDDMDARKLRQFARDLYKFTDLRQLVEVLANRTARLTSSRHCIVYLRDDEGHLEQAAAYHIQLERQMCPILSPDDLEALEARQALVRPRDPIFTLLLPLAGRRLDEHSVLGGILVLGPRRLKRPYDRELLLDLAREGGSALSTAQLLELVDDAKKREDSPSGRADAQARALLARPETALLAIHRLAVEAAHGDEAGVLLLGLPAALRRLHAEDAEEALVDLAEGFGRLLGRPKPNEVTEAVGRLADAAESETAEDWEGVAAARTWYSVCRDALGAARLRDLAHLLPHLESPAAIAAEEAREPADGSEGPWPAQSWVALGDCARAAQAAVGGTPQSVEAALAVALEAADRLEREVAPISEPPERLVVWRVAEHCKSLCEAAFVELRGRSRLEISLLTRHLLAGSEARRTGTLALEIVNRGRQPAERVTARLLPDDAFRIVAEPAAVERLEAGWAAQMDFTVEPRSPRGFSPRFEVCYQEDGQEQALRAEWSVELLEVLPREALDGLRNRYVAGSPLEPTSTMFVGREDLFTTLRDDLERASLVVLSGQRRTGKTSLLRRLPARLGDAYCGVLIDCQGFYDAGPQVFFYTLAYEICEAAGMASLPWEAFAAHPATTFERELLPVVRHRLEGRRLLLLLDEFEQLEELVHRGRLDVQLFTFLRHLLQHTSGLTAIFAGGHRLEELDSDCWSAFFNIALHRRVGLLDEADARRLIVQPVEHCLLYEDLAVRTMLRVTAGHPYFLQLLCSILVEAARREERTYVLLEHVTGALPSVVDEGSGPLESLWEEMSAEERQVLWSVSQRLPLMGQIAASPVMAHLAEHGVTLDQRAVDNALHGLCLRDILKMAEGPLTGPEPTYGWRVWVVGSWVASTRAGRPPAEVARR